MYEKIVIPLDGSELAERALDYVTGLAVASRAQVTLLHVCTPDQSELGPSRFWVYLLEHAAQALRSRLEGAASEGSSVDSTVLYGHPAEEILSYAEKNKVGLIAMTTHGRSGARRWAIGGVADKVARHSPVPVWLVRSDVPEETIRSEWPERRILVLLDGSKRAERALPNVVDHAKVSGAEVLLFRACQRPNLSPFAYSATAMPFTRQEFIERLTTDQLEKCDRYLARLEKRVADAGVRVRSEAILGSSRDEIVRYIDRHSFNLVAYTSRCRCGIARLALGSLAERIVQGCPIPLLLGACRRQKGHASGLGVSMEDPACLAPKS